METYAIQRFAQIFEPYLFDQSYSHAYQLVKDLKHYVCKDAVLFKEIWWRLISNMVLNTNRHYVLEQYLVHKKWSNYELFNLDHDDLDPIKKKIRYDMKFKKMIKKQNFDRLLQDTGGIREGGILVCSMCKSEDIDYLQLQTSRGDEGMTTRAVCNNCGHRWKFR